MKEVLNRKKGIAIVETDKGILLVAKKDRFGLPGGGVDLEESREQAAARELEEEANLKAEKIDFLFEDVDPNWHNRKGEIIKNYSKVFLVKTSGVPKAKNEIKKIKFWKPGSNIKLKDSAARILDKYLELKKSNSLGKI